MKYFASFIFLSLICSITFAQEFTKAREIISNVINVKNITYQDSISKGAIISMRKSMQVYKVGIFYKFREDSVIYTDSLGKKKVMSFWDVQRLNLRKFYKPIIFIKSDSVKFTESEIKYINEEITKMARYKWDKGLFADALLIPTDKINKIFTDNIFKGWAYLKAKHIEKLYSFAPPIFLRDDTYCLFYYSYGCGDLCGQGEFALYKKENGKWVKWFNLFESIS